MLAFAVAALLYLSLSAPVAVAILCVAGAFLVVALYGMWTMIDNTTTQSNVGRAAATAYWWAFPPPLSTQHLPQCSVFLQHAQDQFPLRPYLFLPGPVLTIVSLCPALPHPTGHVGR